MRFSELLRAVILGLISIWQRGAFGGFTASAASVSAESVCHLFQLNAFEQNRFSIPAITKTDALFCNLSLTCVSETQVPVPRIVYFLQV